MNNLPIILIEVVLIFGSVLAFYLAAALDQEAEATPRPPGEAAFNELAAASGRAVGS